MSKFLEIVGHGGLRHWGIWFCLLPGLCWEVGASAAAEKVTASSFFAVKGSSTKQLPAEGIYPSGQKIGFGLYAVGGQNRFDPTRSNMQRVAEQGFTLVGPYYHRDWNDFRYIHEAAQHGLGYTYQIRAHESLRGLPAAERGDALAVLTDAQIAASARTQLETIFADRVARATVSRWSMELEEVRHWWDTEMNYLRVVSQTIRNVEKEHGLEHRPFWMYEANNRASAALQTTGALQDIVSKGHYLTTRFQRGDQRAGWSMWSLDQIVDAAQKLGTVPQAIYELLEDFRDPRIGTNADEIRRVIRHDVYLGLVRGIKSLNVWSMSEFRPKLSTHNEQFEAYGSVATDLTGDLNLQRVFLFAEQQEDLQLEVTAGQGSIKYTHHDGVPYTFPALNYFNAALDDSRYLILVNSSEALMDVSISGLPDRYHVLDLFADEKSAMIDSPQMMVTLPALGVSAFRFSPISEPHAYTPTSLRASAAWAVPEPASVAIMLSVLVGPLLLWPRRR